MSEEIEYPSLKEQGSNLAKFTFEVLKEAFKGGQEKLFVNSDIQKQRLDTCKTCPYFDDSQGRCKHCGCYLTYKVKFALESCPIGKWSESEEDWLNSTFDNIKEGVLNPDPEVDRPRFPADVIIGDKYSWTLPPPDGRTLHWFWNGATWEFDPDPDTPNYSDEEIASYRAEREAIQLEEMQAQGVGISALDKLAEQDEWDRYKRIEAGEDIPEEIDTTGGSIESIVAQYRRREAATEEKQQQMSQEAAMDMINDEDDSDEDGNLIDSIIDEVMDEIDNEVEEQIKQEEEEENKKEEEDTGEENVPIDPMINSMIKDFREELVDKVSVVEEASPPKKKRTYKKKTTTATDTTTPKKRGRPKKVKTEENTETTE